MRYFFFIMLFLAVIFGGLAVVGTHSLRGVDQTRVPLHAFPAVPSISEQPDCSANAMNQAVSDAFERNGISMAEPSGLQRLPKGFLGRFVTRIENCMPSSLDSSQVHLNGSIVAAWIKSAYLPVLRPRAHRVCRMFRWQSSSFAEVADACSGVLSGWPAKLSAGNFASEYSDALGDAPVDLIIANKQAIIHPFEGKYLIRLVIELEKVGFQKTADRLRDEAMLLHPDIVTAIENASARSAQYR